MRNYFARDEHDDRLSIRGTGRCGEVRYCAHDSAEAVVRVWPAGAKEDLDDVRGEDSSDTGAESDVRGERFVGYRR